MDGPPFTPAGENVSAIDRVKAMFDFKDDAESSTRKVMPQLMKEYHGWGAQIFDKELELIAASSEPHGSTTYTFTIQARHCNRLNNLHGGCTATIFDICTTTALGPIAKPGFWAYAGVSRTLNVTYIRPAPEGMKVIIHSEVVHAGKRLCTIKSVMKRASDDAVIAICEHGKASIDPEVSKL